MFCTSCGAENPRGSAFCTSCGAPMGGAPDSRGGTAAADESGAPEDAALITRGDCELVYEDSRYQVYTFASAADVHAAAEAARAEG